MAKPNAPERVFISYSHDTEIHKGRALDFANRLREDGVDANIDQYEESPEHGWPLWMERQIRDADFVVVIGSELYHDRLLGDEIDGVGLGAKWEGGILRQHLYESDMKTKGFIPAIFSEDDARFIPTPLRAFTRYLIDGEEGYEKIYRRITNQPKAQKPRLGTRRKLPTPDAKSGGTIYVGGAIDVDLWNSAKWRGTFFVTGEFLENGQIPYLGIGFSNPDAGLKIFEGWSERFGDNNSDEELRISIIEGPIQGQEAGYTVHIGTELDETFKKLSQKSKMDENDLMMSITRLNRMTPPASSINLERFKTAVR
ncbi:SEFIR domain-containing protein [Loktanella sp. Alg231-35]|uniref:SEFIR domain-containing protein n=1 Tax=Loktanella sp. Alg231-35 TaxID=1922220 RepID=UPI00131F1A99|nr:SEFIR domain-containing protein [Loktanella sp. Alg231-35]